MSNGKRDLKGGKANNTGSPYDGDDILLKTKHERRVEEKETRPSKHRVELQTLYLNKNSEDLIMETLKHIHGPDFKLKDHSSYRDKGSNLKDQYWVNRGNLVVQGGIDYSAKTPRTENEIINIFAVSKLEGYGFHKSHCLEALDVTNGDVGVALEVLQNEYFNLGFKFPSSTISNSEGEENETECSSEGELDRLTTQREDEKNSLKSIYEDQFEEKIANKVWVLNLELDYLLDVYNPPPANNDWDGEQSRKPKKEKPKVQMCSYYFKGQCKYAHNCRFSHLTPTPVKVETPEKHLFQLEIRFGELCKYPEGIPFVFLTTQAPKFPPEACLRLSYRLIQEAQMCAQRGECFVFELVQFVQENVTEMTTSLFGKFDIELFLNPKRLLFPLPEVEEIVVETQETTWSKGLSKRLPRPQVSMADLLSEDVHIAKRLKDKQKNDHYKKHIIGRKLLPAYGKVTDILNLIRDNQVIVISGETGCGKSTQVPQFILDDWLLNVGKLDGNRHVEIVCTQPRRISAIGVAERVSDERAERVGNTVGYQIRLESRTSSSTRLLFCTTGILLRRLESDPTLTNVSHVIVDEVHERSEESDFLLLILKEMLIFRPDLKVILMSATLNAELFSQYFGQAPTLEIPGRTFPVQEFFLEDIVEETQYVLEENSKYTRSIKKGYGEEQMWEIELETADLQIRGPIMPSTGIKDECLTLKQMIARYQGYKMETVKTLYLMDPGKIDYDLVEKVLTWIVSGAHDYPRTGSILVFLPGMAEISTLHDQLQSSQLFNPKYGKFILLPLHSSLSSEDQSAVFRKPKAGCRKVVISTNIAETSVTIDDCVFVIDCGKMKEKRFDANKNMESLDMAWVSRANALQRKGRAGRVMAGVCVHLYTHHRYAYHFLAQPIPELHRVPLEQLLLRIKTLPNFADQDPHIVLSGTLEPPAAENIDSALERLKDVGALDKKKQLTPLGRHLAALPVDVRVGKLMLFGAIFCCVDSALTIAACLSFKSPFLSPFDKKELADKKKKEFSTANSDQMTVLKAYKCWLKECLRSNAAGYNFARENYLSQRTLVQLADIKHQFLELLASIGFVDVQLGRKRSGQDRVLEMSGPGLNVNGENVRLLSAILCAALYPNVVKVLTPEKSFAQGAAGALPKDIRAEELKFKTRDDGYVFLHPTSVNYSVNYYTSPYLVYQEKVKTSRIFIRDCSMVPMLPLILFSGCGLKVELNRGTFVLALEDGWIKFAVDTHQIAEMLHQIREELVKLLEEKIEDPSINLLTHDHGRKIISTIVHLVT